MEIRRLSITPQLATEMLKRNLRNRAPKPKKLIEYQGVMERGEWDSNNGDAMIGFTESPIEEIDPLVGKDSFGDEFSIVGTLSNGQHRLEALIRAEITIEMWVAIGVSDDAIKTLDRRLAAQTL